LPDRPSALTYAPASIILDQLTPVQRAILAYWHRAALARETGPNRASYDMHSCGKQGLALVPVLGLASQDGINRDIIMDDELSDDRFR
jgi:hypothetical protein